MKRVSIAAVVCALSGVAVSLAVPQGAAAEPIRVVAGASTATPPLAIWPGTAAPTGDRLAELAERALDALGHPERLVWTPEVPADVNSSEYRVAREAVAGEVGARLGIDPARFVAAWTIADADHQVAVMAALSQVGTPYKRRMSVPGVGFDCSGLTTYAWGTAGFVLPRNSTAQINAAEPRDVFTAQAGDLVRYPGHVMMWLGVDRAIVHSPNTGRRVEVVSLNERRFVRSRMGDPS